MRRVANTREAGRFLIVQDELLMGVALLGGRQGSPDGGKGLAERGGGVGTKRYGEATGRVGSPAGGRGP